MRLHRFVSALCVTCAVFWALAASSAHADGTLSIVNGPKHLESAPGANVSSVAPSQKKMRALFSTQAQLFVEQKDAPTASKTALRMDTAPRLSEKSKD